MPVPEEWDLSGKVALLTADRRGWGPFLAAALAEAGADVVVAARRQEDAEQAAAAVTSQGRNGMAIAADVSRAPDVRRSVEEVTSRFGKLDVMVNSAQAQLFKPATEVTEEEFDSLFQTNVKAVFLGCQEAGKQMLRQGSGRIVNIISHLGARGLWNGAVYSASQAAVLRLTQSLALDWSRSNIRVNGIGFGWFSPEEKSLEEQRKDLLVRFIPSRRLGHPRELGPLLVYLASDACDFVTGHTVFLDGGTLAHP